MGVAVRGFIVGDNFLQLISRLMNEEVKEGEKVLFLDLDHLWELGYIYSDYDISGAGHSQTIRPQDREAFLDDMAAKYRKQIESILEERVKDW